MYCPVCGQQQISDEIRFCSRCGFLLAGVSEVVASGGVLPGAAISRSQSPRNRGIKQGLFIFLLSFLIVPIVAIISVALRAEPYAAAFTAILLTVGGLLRMAYALLFEPNSPVAATLEDGFPSPSSAKALKRPIPAALNAPQQPASDYVSPSAGAWRDTNELEKQRIGSVTEGTTKLLEQERDTQ